MMVSKDEASQNVPVDGAPTRYTIEQVATRTGLTKRTLRYYEEMELLLLLDRSGGNYRLYTEADVERIERIKELRNLLGFSLTEIRELLQSEEERGQIKVAFRQETDAQIKIQQLDRADELIHKQITLIEKKISGLEQMRIGLAQRLENHTLKKNALGKDSL